MRETTEMMLDGIIRSLTVTGRRGDRQVHLGVAVHPRRQRERGGRAAEEDLQYCKEENGACYLDLETFGIHGKSTKFFFTRADGTTLYTTRDMAYHLDKFSRADVLINVLGEDQKLGQQQLAAALKILGKECVPECVFYSFVSLPEGRMSTRKGVVVYLDDLIDEAVDRAYEEVR